MICSWLSGRVRLAWLLALLPWAAARADVLDFEDVVLPATGLGSVASPYLALGYSLAASSGFSARGPGTDSANFTPETSPGSGEVSTSLAAFAPATITLSRPDGLPFALQSIDLAREFRFNTPDVGQAYPVVTFTGTTSGGGTVVQEFVADQAEFAFLTFSFSAGFTDLVSVSWEQPPFTSGTPTNPAPGLHQFDNIVLTVVPEPRGVILTVLGLVAIGGLAWRSRVRRLAGA